MTKNERIKVLFLAEGRLAPSTRFRVLQLIEGLKSFGVDSTVRFGYGARYNDVQGTAFAKPYKLLARARRILAGFVQPGRYDIILVQRPLFPFSAIPEELLTRARGSRVVFDIDDAVFLAERGEKHPVRFETYQRITAAVDHTICGNEYLADHVADGAQTTIIPTVIDTDRYCPPTVKSNEEELVVGWIGSATTLWHLEAYAKQILTAVESQPNAILRVIGPSLPSSLENHPRVDFVPWSEDGEIPALQTFDIGVMPLCDREISLGKCGFKMIQYMAIGIPVVASPIGANVDIFEGSQAGFLVRDDAEWTESLVQLLADAELREKMGASAREHAIESYSVKSVLPRYRELFERLIARSDERVESTGQKGERA